MLWVSIGTFGEEDPKLFFNHFPKRFLEKWFPKVDSKLTKFVKLCQIIVRFSEILFEILKKGGR